MTASDCFVLFVRQSSLSFYLSLPHPYPRWRPPCEKKTRMKLSPKTHIRLLSLMRVWQIVWGPSRISFQTLWITYPKHREGTLQGKTRLVWPKNRQSQLLPPEWVICSLKNVNINETHAFRQGVNKKMYHDVNPLSIVSFSSTDQSWWMMLVDLSKKKKKHKHVPSQSSLSANERVM